GSLSHTQRGLRVERLLSRLWWLPGTLAVLVSAIYIFAAVDTGDFSRWGPRAALWLALAVCFFWRLSPRRGPPRFVRPARPRRLLPRALPRPRVALLPLPLRRRGLRRRHRLALQHARHRRRTVSLAQLRLQLQNLVAQLRRPLEVQPLGGFEHL